MNLEQNTVESDKSNLKTKFEIEEGYRQFIPREFWDDPVGYFEETGRNIKPGDMKKDETGKVRDDPSAVKEFPAWKDVMGNELNVVGKKINVTKGEVGKSGDPFYEYKVLEIVHELGLPAQSPVAKVESGNSHFIFTEKVKGVNWYEKKTLLLKDGGWTDSEIENLKNQAETKMAELKARFDEVGIVRGWKLKDMVFDIDLENKQVRSITPVDWERTKIDVQKLDIARRKNRPREDSEEGGVLKLGSRRTFGIL